MQSADKAVPGGLSMSSEIPDFSLDRIDSTGILPQVRSDRFIALSEMSHPKDDPRLNLTFNQTYF
jgi:hypothetical protein